MDKYDNKAFLGIIGVCLAYILIECCLIHYAAVSMDDFWLTDHNREYLWHIPYRDFAPYKTVLGYYLLSPPLWIWLHGLHALISIKIWLMCLNAVSLCAITWWARSIFSTRALFFTLILIIFNPIFLYYSSEVRVDILAYWVALWSVLLCIRERYVWAGIGMGIAFLICQKVLWHMIAMDLGLLAIAFQRRDTIVLKIWNIILFNLLFVFILMVYIGFWSFLSNLDIVLRSIWQDAYIVASTDWYLSKRSYFWHMILTMNPGWTLLWLMGLLGIWSFSKPSPMQIFITVYSLVIFAFIVTYTQPFAYYMFAVLPVIFVVYSYLFTWIYSNQSTITFNKKVMLGGGAIYFMLILWAYYAYGIPDYYLMILILPMLFWMVGRDSIPNGMYYIRYGMTWMIGLVGVITSMLIFCAYLPDIDGRYQRATIRLAEALVEPGDTYIAGVPLLSQTPQSILGLQHLVGPSVGYLRHPTYKLYRIMNLKALYFSPATVSDMIDALNEAPVKFYIDNNRFHWLPKALHDYLHTRYRHFWGSIYLYAPYISKGHQQVHIKFSGQYALNAKSGVYLKRITGWEGPSQAPQSDGTLYLTKGMYESDASEDFRLVFIPHISEVLNPAFKENQWAKVLNSA
jgi:hypothetical protein